ncbi:MAG: hypothetical protein R3C40_06525 [Parvularculaceae bacterium]
MLTAYHEAGHALVGISVPGNDPVHKATIIPRGRALGMVQYLPERDRYSMTFEQMKARIAMAMGGRVAEELKIRGRESHLRRTAGYRARHQDRARHGDAIRIV